MANDLIETSLMIRQNETIIQEKCKIIWCPTCKGRPARIYFDGKIDRYSCTGGHQGVVNN